jgi:PAS domain S-box-containing protein
MTSPTRALVRTWAPAFAAALVPLAAAALFPSLTVLAAGWALLALTAALSTLAVSVAQARRLTSAIERVSEDIESSPARNFGHYVREGDWGLLGDLAAAFDWMLQEVQGHLANADRQLLDERARVGALIHAIPDGVLLANLRGEVLYVNGPAVQMLGLKPEELKQGGAGLYAALPHEDLKRALERILEHQARQEIVDLEIEGPKGRQVRHFKSTASLFTNLEDQALGVVVVIRDVTAEREVEKMKEDFFHAVAHDLRAPVFGIQGYARMLERSRPLSPQEKGYIAAIYQSCERLARLVTDILDIARLDSPQPELKLAPVVLDSVIESVRSSLAAAADEKGVRLDARVLEGPLELRADERLLERALENLVANGLKFTPAGGRVTVEARRAVGGIEVSVADTGPGIPPEQLEVVFEKYRQLQRGGEPAGFGLGLTIARQVVMAHGGRIHAESSEGEGATFVLTLPV